MAKQTTNNNVRKGRKPRTKKPRSKPANDYDTKDDAQGIRRGDQPSHSNPFELYSRNALLIENASKINTNNPIGVPYTIFSDNTWKSMVDDGIIATSAKQSAMVPGIACFEFVGGPGASRDSNSAVNVAANALYSYIRHANSGAANYDSTSCMMLMLAMDSAYMWHYLLTRLYGTLNLYSAENRFYPKCIVHAQGFDFDSCRNNMNNLEFVINRFSKVLNSLYIPKFNVFLRHQWCCENYFLDDNSVKAQTYLFKPAGLHFLQEASTDKTTFGDLIYVPWSQLGSSSSPNYLKYEDIVEVCDRLANILQYSSDVALISGDVKKAFDVSNCMSVPSITSDFTKLPVVDEVVLSMIHNMSIMDYSHVNDADFNITQKLDPMGYFYVTWDPLAHYIERFSDTYTAKFSKACNYSNRILNYYVDNPSTELITESTRFTTISNNGSQWAHGTELVINQKIFNYSVPSNQVTFHSFKQISTETASIAECSVFKSYPLQLRFTPNTTADKIAGYAIFGELDNYTVVSYDQLLKLHEAAVLSEWDVPSIANYV